MIPKLTFDKIIIICVCSILVIFLVYQKYLEEKQREEEERQKQKIQEGFGFDDIIRPIKAGFEKTINDMKGGFNKMIDDMTSGIRKIIDPIINLFKEIQHQFDVLPRRFQGLRDGFDKSFKGIEYGIKNFGVALGTSAYDSLLVPAHAGWMSIEYLMCGFKVVTNLPTCILAYALDFIFYCITFLIESLIGAFDLFLNSKNLFGFTLVEKYRGLWDLLQLDQIDSSVHELTGFHIFKYPDSITQKCYSCNPTVTPKVILEDAERVNYDFHEMWPRMMNEPQDYFRQSKDRFYDFINPRL